MNRAAAGAKWGAPPRVSPRLAPALDPDDPAEFAAFRNNCSFTQNKHARAAQNTPRRKQRPMIYAAAVLKLSHILQ